MGYQGLDLKNIMYRSLALVFLFAANAPAQITLEIQDYAALPITGLVDGKTNYDALLARVSGLREEPGGASVGLPPLSLTDARRGLAFFKMTPLKHTSFQKIPNVRLACGSSFYIVFPTTGRKTWKSLDAAF